jgi:signal peptidase
MQPTLDTGDGFVAIPEAVAGEIEEGDVITFRAEELQGGGLTTQIRSQTKKTTSHR